MTKTTRLCRTRGVAFAALLIAVSSLAPFRLYATGIPVVDAMAIAQDKINQVERIAKAVEQINQLKAQIDQMKLQYKALTGTRNLGDLAQNPALRDYLPPDWRSVYDGVANGGYRGLTGSARTVREISRVFDTCARLSGPRKTQCERSSSKAAMDKAFAVEAYDKARARWDQISLLTQSINQTSDPKSIAELQARINAEQAALQNEQTKLQMYQLIADAEGRLIDQQRAEQNARTWASGGRGISAQPITFGD